MTTTSLPYRLSEKAFRFYEPLIAKIVETYPKPLTIDPMSYGRRLGTFENRLRDAIRSLRDNRWPTTVDMVKLSNSQIVVSVAKSGKVIIGSRDSVKDSPETLPAIVATSTAEPLVITADFSPTEAHLVARLAHERALCRPIQVYIADSLAEELEASYDVYLEHNNDGSYTLT